MQEDEYCTNEGNYDCCSKIVDFVHMVQLAISETGTTDKKNGNLGTQKKLRDICVNSSNKLVFQPFDEFILFVDFCNQPAEKREVEEHQQKLYNCVHVA